MICMSGDYPIDFEWEDEFAACYECNGTGQVLICCDDLCHGLGYCMHGDGEIMCHVCKGSGEIAIESDN